MFPSDLPVMKGIDYAGSCREALGIGGDYYDFLPLPGNKLGLALGDVSGKGIAAALLMAGLQGRLQSLATGYRDRVAALLTGINHLMSSPDCARYISFFYAVFDPTRNLLTYSNAGHPPPLLLRSGKGGIAAFARLDAGGTVLGLFRDTGYEQRSVSVCTGDILVMYSDGVSEATDDRGEEFGDERLADTILRGRHSDAAGLRDLILAEVSRYTSGTAPHDDRTLVVAKFC
jgi:sigma-B regulation protein RsbU (phosphoserine phosphatase)